MQVEKNRAVNWKGETTHERFVWNEWGSMSVWTNDAVHGVDYEEKLGGLSRRTD